MAAVYTDGTYTSAAATSAPVFEAPLPHTTALLVLRQKFCIAQSSYAALALNTAHATYSDYKLVAEGPQTDLGEGIVEWERIYAKVPDSHSEPAGTYTYVFPGFAGNVITAGIEPYYRAPRSEIVQSQRTFDYYLIDDGEDPLDTIPIIQAQTYVFLEDPKIAATELYDNPPYNVSTIPSRTEYEDMIDDDDWNIVVEQSSIERWMGNIWRRATLRVKAI